MQKVGQIQGLEIHPSEPVTEGQGHLFLLFHGYGADAYDLQSLGDVIQTGGPTHWIFPQGILSVPIGPGWTGRAWWNIDIDRLQRMAATGEPQDLSQEKPANLVSLREAVFATVQQLGVPWKQVILGGFSQGAMLATDIALNAPENPKALVILSGNLINKDEWKAKAPQRKGLPFYMSHGRFDGVLGLKGAQQLETLLTQSGLKGRLQVFEGHHEIPMSAITQLNQFLAKA